MAKQHANKTENAVEMAERVIAELEAKRAALVAARADDDRQMGSVSYRAHAHGDPEANDQLNGFVENTLRHEQQIKSIDAALVVAKQEHAAAVANAQAADTRRVAKEVRGLLKSLREAGSICDEALSTFAGGSEAMGEIVAKMNALGFNHPSAQHLQSLGERAIRSMLVQSIFARSFETIAPRERQNFNEFVSRWCVSLEREIAARLGEAKQTEAA